MKKYLAILLTLAMIFALAACGATTDEETTAPEETSEEVVSEEVSEEVSEDSSEAVSEDASEAVSEDASEAASEDASEDASEGETEEAKVPSTKEEILAAYTAVMNQAKKDAPAYKKIEWQTLPDDANSRIVSEGSSVVNTALNLAQNNFMTSEEDTKADPEIKEKGSSMSSFPICNSKYGCLLTNTSAIKSAKCEVLSNGNYKITIVLNDEKNPEPVKSEDATTAPSNHGGIFSPVSKKDIDDTLNGGIVSAVAKDIVYSLTYHDCSSCIEYDPTNNHLVSVVQFSKVAISGSGKIAFIKLGVTKQELVDEMHIYDIKY